MIKGFDMFFPMCSLSLQIGIFLSFPPYSCKKGNYVSFLIFRQPGIGVSDSPYALLIGWELLSGDCIKISMYGHAAVRAFTSTESLSWQGEPYLLGRWLYWLENKLWVSHSEFWQIQLKVSRKSCHSAFRIWPCRDAMSSTKWDVRRWE